MTLDEGKKRELAARAEEMLRRSYVPYSGFSVGAALLCKNGEIFTGCNIENASYPATNCAERTAIFKAVSEGFTEFTAIAVVGGFERRIESFCPPCGVCRQVMAEFCDPETFQVILANAEGELRTMALKELLPMSFTPDHLQRE